MENTPLVKQGWLRALIFIPILILSIILSLSIFSFVVDKTGIKFPSKVIERSFSEFFQILGLYFAINFSCHILDNKNATFLGLNFKLKDFLLGCFLGIILITTGCVVLAMLGWADFEFKGFDLKGLFIYLILFILVAIFEEFLVRTYLLHSFMQSMNKYLALVITSLIFSILHGLNPGVDLFSLIELFLAGIMLGLWYIHRGNIWFPIGLHFTWNYFQGPVWGHEVSGHAIKESILKQIDIAETMFSGGKFGLEGSVIGLVVTILGCLWVEWYARKNQTII